MENAKLMQLEIEKKRKLPREVKENIKTKIFHTLLAAVIILAYLVAINLMYYKFEHAIFEQYMKYFALAIIMVTVVEIEVAYRKDSKMLTLIGIELFLCAVLSLYIPYIYLHTTAYLRNSIMILPAVLLIYYAFKSFVIYKRRSRKGSCQVSSWTGASRNAGKKCPADIFSDAARRFRPSAPKESIALQCFFGF